MPRERRGKAVFPHQQAHFRCALPRELFVPKYDSFARRRDTYRNSRRSRASESRRYSRGFHRASGHSAQPGALDVAQREVSQAVIDGSPLHAVTLLQDAWGSGWNTADSLIVAGILVLASVVSVYLFRW